MRQACILSLIMIISMIMTSCSDAVDKSLILGHWTGSEWQVDGVTAAYDPHSASFTFEGNGQYSYSYADQNETGTYFISNNQLYTTPEGGTKMMVRIHKLTQDTLIFDMNRGGTAERLTLTRK